MFKQWIAADLFAIALGVITAGAGDSAALCLPPRIPDVSLSPALLTEYRAEISGEFETYFSAISAYIACLDAERTRSLDEARDAASSYAVFLDTIPAQRTFP